MAPDNKNDDAFTGAIGVVRENSRQVDISQDKPLNQWIEEQKIYAHGYVGNREIIDRHVVVEAAPNGMPDVVIQPLPRRRLERGC
ncbi:hypothetical protein V496_02262 [Pseudogymnoascus sp. VKM F-4515 (FW-2607)]|nr:hypothetical protein V496_02262 [Pseudogymnoascus sp. VKM F-4515 (FW-2607)]